MKNNNNQDNQSYHYEEVQISAIELWRILMRRKLIVITTFVVLMVGSIIYVQLATPVYKSEAVLHVGQIDQVGQIENVPMLEQRLMSEYPEIKSIVRLGGGRDLSITLTVHSYSKNEAEQALKHIVDKLVSEHNIAYKNAITPLEQQYNSLRKLISDFKNQVTQLNAQIELLKHSQPAQAAILMIEKGDITREISELENNATEINLSLIEPKSTKTRLLGKIISPKQPIKPNKKHIVVLAAVLGLMLGVFMAFFVEFIMKTAKVNGKTSE